MEYDPKAVTENIVIINGSDMTIMNPKFIQLLQKDLENDIQHRLTQSLEKIQKEV